MKPETRAKIHKLTDSVLGNYYLGKDMEESLCHEIREALAAEPDEPKLSKSTRELIGHCASIAVNYMEETDYWTGTVADSGHLRHAILDADYSGFEPTVSKSMEELVLALYSDAFDPWAFNKSIKQCQGDFDCGIAAKLIQQFLDAQIVERDKTIERLEGKIKELLDEPDDDF